MYRFFRYILFLMLLCGAAGCGKQSVRSHRDFPIWGLDVSRHQDHINWARVVQHERPCFVLIKATEGTLIEDPTYDRHRRELEKAGVLWGAYHFFGHRTSGKEQARKFIETARLGSGNIVPVLDIEKHRFMTDPRKSVREALEFSREIRRHFGVNPIIYCSTHFYNEYLKRDFRPGDYTLWIADYRGEPPLRWTLWQHTQSHTIRGIRGKVDRNVFDGTEKEFEKLILK